MCAGGFSSVVLVAGAVAAGGLLTAAAPVGTTDRAPSAWAGGTPAPVGVQAPTDPLDGRDSADAGSAISDTIPVWELAGDPDSDEPVERGAYLARVGNCVTCHTEEDAEETDFMAGGPPVEADFGTFYGTNITPDPDHGIGGWSEGDLARALREGRGPDGTHFYPAFPYTSFTGMSDGDVADLYAFLMEVPPVARENRPHDLPWYMSVRTAVAAWNAFNFREGRFQQDPERDEEWNRGAYLSRAVAHCSECHSSRTTSGGVDEDLRYAGTSEGMDGDPVPNITPHDETGIGGWSERHLTRYLDFGMDPDGDFAGGSMGAVISRGTSYMTDDDRRVLVRYIRSLEPIDHSVD